MAGKKPTFISKDAGYEWQERRGKEWLFFGKPFHKWHLLHRSPGHTGEFSVIENAEYQRLKDQQNTNPCKVASLRIYDKETKIVRVGWYVYWFQSAFYEVTAEFPEEHVMALIRSFNEDQRASASKIQRERANSIQAEIDRLRG